MRFRRLGAVLVPINYRLSPEEFQYIITHSGATVVCAHEDYLECVDALRPQLPGVRHFVALEGHRDGWLDYESLLKEAQPAFTRPTIEETDLLTINYTSGTTSRPKGVMITHRNAYITPSARCCTSRCGCRIGISGRCRCSTRTAGRSSGSSPRSAVPSLFAKSRSAEGVRARRDGVGVHSVRRADGADCVAGAPAEVRAAARKGVRVVTAGAPPAAATIERVEGELGWTITHVYGLTETAPFITVCEPRPEHDALSGADRAVIKARQGVELITSGDLRVVDEEMRDVPRDGATVGEIVVRGNVVMKGYYNDPRRPRRRCAADIFTAATPRSCIPTATSTSATG